MLNFKSLKCRYCDTVIANLPEAEIKKLDGQIFLCDCCNHFNTLDGYELKKCVAIDYSGVFKLIGAHISI